jgi:hypothetical protein
VGDSEDIQREVRKWAELTIPDGNEDFLEFI